MTIEHDAKINILEERFDSHSERWDASFDKILKEIDNLKDENKMTLKESYNWRESLLAKVNKLYFSIIIGLIGILVQIVFMFVKK